ncbi:uncharacterized protein LOC143286923 isoform X2 [Babylonia areolata]|uniref:uncharacterized protein LOC143286923 isoform X2 n=1 Tax=Babylonia areolata TaxID=304850 RepID=UPI003FD47510
MIRFAALNESDSEEEEDEQEDEPATTKEAEEAEAFAVYNRALGLQRAGDTEGAEQLFSNLLQHPFVLKAQRIVEVDQEDSHHPALPLLYLVHKNLATSAVARGNLHDAMKSYLEAVKIDSSEVTVWYKMGTVAKQIHNYPLAKLAFEQGLQCNERHWPSLDAVITVLYALNDYAVCLEYCGRALERDPYYTKGLVFSRQILKEQPSLTSISKELFAYCDPIIHTVSVEPEETERMIKECVAIRDKRRQLAKRPDPPPLKLPRPITQLTWRCVGECLVELFDDFTTCNPPKSLVLPLDMREYFAMAEGRADHPEDHTTSTPTTSAPSPSVTPSAATIATTTTTSTTTTTTDTTSATQPECGGSGGLQKMESESAPTAESLLPASSSGTPGGVSAGVGDLGVSTGVDDLGVKTAVSDPASRDRQGEQAMDVGDTAVQPGPAHNGDSDKGPVVMESTETTGVKLDDNRAAELTVSDTANTGPEKHTEEMDVDSTAEGGGQEMTGGELSGGEPASLSQTPGKDDANASGDVPVSSGVSVDQRSSSPAVDAARSTQHMPCTPAGQLSSVSTPATSALSSDPSTERAEASPKFPGVTASGAVVKTSDSTSSKSVTSSSGGGITMATSSSTTGQGVNSTQVVREGGQQSAVQVSSEVTKGAGLPAPGSAVHGTEQNQGQLTSKQNTPTTQQLSVDVEMMPASTAAVTSSLLSSMPKTSAADDVASSVAAAPAVSAVPTTSLLTPVTSSAVSGGHPPASSISSVPSPSGKSSPSSQQALGRPSTSPSLPKYRFNTITPTEVQALLQDCVPSTPLLSTPAPSSYSSSLLERFKQAAPVSSAPSSASVASGSQQSQAGVAADTSVVASTAITEPATSTAGTAGTVGGVTVEAGGDVEKTTALSSPSNQHQSAVSTPVSAEVALQDHVGMGRGARGNRRGTKRKRAPVEKPVGVVGPEDYGIKRRSARVRNTRKEAQENVDIQKLLHNFLPTSLTQPVQDDEESQVEDPGLTSQVAADATAAELCGGPPLEETEEEEVRSYLKQCVKRQGVVGLMYKYLVHLSSRDNRVWPAGVAELYLKVYERARDHLTFPSLYCMDFPEVCYTELSKMALVWSELVLDGFLVKRADTVISPVTAQRQEAGPSDSGLFTDLHAEEDLLFITGMVESGLIDLLGSQQISFALRVYWMTGRLALAENQMDKALETLELVKDYLNEENGITKVFLPNCHMDKTISLEEVKRQQESLKRCQSLEESQRLFDAGQYQQVIDSLTATCLLPQATQRTFKPALPERHAQLELLQDALYQQEDWGRCLLWGEVVLDEALHHYRRAPTLTTRDSWALTLVHLLEGLQRVLDRETNAMQLLPLRSLVRLTQNLIRIIEVNHDVSELVTEMPIASVLPWMLLYKIIRQEEDKVERIKVAEEEEEEEGGSPSSSPKTSLSPSLMLLSVAHEYLGRNAWCTRECGIFLQFYMDVLTTELPKAHNSVKDDLGTAFEQCVFCLYGHPNKKGRARHLVDHNAPCIDLMWEHCEAVFEYFKPKMLPEFDSYKTSTVSAELHNLLRRIYDLIPDTDDVNHRVTQVHSYIEGNSSTPPNYTSSCIILQEIYYLLADYYFKNKEQTKAIKFYTYDVCFNSSRFDSWAGLALAKMYQLEQKLNSMELKIDTPVHKKSITALRCFSRAVEVDESVRKLWIEYGSLAYQLHSHASRQLRMKLWFPLTPEHLDIAMETRVEMLSTARNCYWKASKCEAEGSEEEWLHHYMMGKVMEKQRVHPRLYLEHYKQAAIYLHEEEAKYPRKIQYHSSPPHLSLEALEMYYRLHVAVMKHLLRISSPETKDDMVLFDRYLTEATESPFALQKEKHYEVQDSVSSADDSQCSDSSVPPYSTAHQRPVYHMTPQDHNYSKQKSSGGETSDASCEVKETGTETDGSQSSEETDGVTTAKDAGQASSTSAESNAGTKKGASSEGEGVEQGKQDNHESSHMDMVELHAETDSQISDHLPDTKPLFYDKQISGGFVPQLDKHLTLVGLSPSPSTSATPTTPTTATSINATTTTTIMSTTTSTTSINTTTTTTSINTTSTTIPPTTEVAACRQVPKEDDLHLADGIRGENPILMIDKVKGEAPMETDAEEGGQKQHRDRGQHREVCGVSIKPPSSSLHPASETLGRRREEIGGGGGGDGKGGRDRLAGDPVTDANVSVSSDSSSVIVISSADEPSQDGREKKSLTPSASCAPTAPAPPVPVPSELGQSSHASPNNKRPLENSQEPIKRVKLDFGDTERVKSEQGPDSSPGGAKAKKDANPGHTDSSEIKQESGLSAVNKPEGSMEVDEGGGGGAAENVEEVRGKVPSTLPGPSLNHPSGRQQGPEQVKEEVDKSVVKTKEEVDECVVTIKKEKEEGLVKMKDADTCGGDLQPAPTDHCGPQVPDHSSGDKEDTAARQAPSTPSDGLASATPTAGERPASATPTPDDRQASAMPTPGDGQAPATPTPGDRRAPAPPTPVDLQASAGKGVPHTASTLSPHSQQDRTALGELRDKSAQEQAKEKASVQSNGSDPSPSHLTGVTSSLGRADQKSSSIADPSSSAREEEQTPPSAHPQRESTSNQPGQKQPSTAATHAGRKTSTINLTEQKTTAASKPAEQKKSTDPPKPGSCDSACPTTLEPTKEQPSLSGPQAEQGTSSSAGGQGQKEADAQPVVLGEEEFREWKRKLLDKCVEGLHICLSRFPTHYKSLYRLAYLFYASDTHRNLQFARDLLLGNPNWPNTTHMPANGLFHDRRVNNFFNGTWKIPIDEIDRSGSFASHVNRSVQLLLEVLRDLGEVATLLQVQSQLKKKPLDQARKYLRDGERHILAQMAHSYTLDAVAQQLCRPRGEVDSTDLLLSAFRAYNSHRCGGETQRAVMLLITAFHRLGLPKHGYGTPLEQAMQYCTTLIASQAQAQKAERGRLPSQVSTPTSLFTTPSSSSSHPATPHTVESGTIPLPLHQPTPPGRPLGPVQGSGGGHQHGGHSGPAATGGRGHSATLSPLRPPGPHHHYHPSSSTTASAFHASTPRPAHAPTNSTPHSPHTLVTSSTPCPPHTHTSSTPRPSHAPTTSRPRTLSGSRGDTPSAYDVSGAMSRQPSTSAALDLSPPGHRVTVAPRVHAHGPGSQRVSARVGPGPGVEVIDLTSPEKGAEAMKATSPVSSWPRGVAGRYVLPPRVSRGGGSGLDLAGRMRTPSPGGRPPWMPGGGGLGGMRSIFPSTSTSTSLAVKGAPPPSHPRPSPSPFSSPHPFHPSSSPAPSSTPRPHAVSTAHGAGDRDLTSQQENELALTSPDKLTSDVRHHFHRDLL